MTKRRTLIPVFTILCLFLGGNGIAAEINYAEVLLGIASRIESSKKDFPQLREFSPSTNTNLQNLSIEYSYHTHAARHRGGWTSGVPNPDDDGIWFYIDFHDPESTRQIHTQPVVPLMCLGRKIAFVLILEGKDTKPFRGTIPTILESFGAQQCTPKPAMDFKK